MRLLFGAVLAKDMFKKKKITYSEAFYMSLALVMIF